MQSPSEPYYSERYLHNKDRWTNMRQNDPLVCAHLECMRNLVLPSHEYDCLDIGCGTLCAAVKIAENFPNVRIHGIDFALDAILAKHRRLPDELTKHAITFEKADLFTYSSPIIFDFIFDIGLFHHLVPADWEKYIGQIDRYLKQGGSLFLYSFHPSDGNWNDPRHGGHVRKDYYCHYHDIFSLNEIFGGLCSEIKEVELCRHEEHVVGLYHLVRGS